MELSACFAKNNTGHGFLTEDGARMAVENLSRSFAAHGLGSSMVIE
jgi:hypothetical protein